MTAIIISVALMAVAVGLDQLSKYLVVTNMELYEYIKAYDSLVFGVNGNMVYNPTSIDVYLDLWSRRIIVKAGETVTFS